MDDNLSRQFWKSLGGNALPAADAADTVNEFADGASDASTVDRREFLRLMGASLALASVACQQKQAEKIVPYVKEPEQMVPGKPLYFATSMTLGGFATGLLATSQMGRPSKLDGNALHPANLGASDAVMQGALLNLYDPQRAQGVMYLNRISTWDSFAEALNGYLEIQTAKAGAGLRILSEASSSPTLAAMKAKLLAKFPRAKWTVYEPVHRDLVYEGTRRAFGSALEPIYEVAAADVIVSFGADLFSEGPGRLRAIRDFARRRKIHEKSTTLNRVYVVEATPSLMGARAEHRQVASPQQAELLLYALAGRLGLAGFNGATVDGISEELLAGMAADLRAAAGKSLVVVGETASASMQAAGHLINVHLSNVGKTVRYVEPVLDGGLEQESALRALVSEMDAGNVELLVTLGGNPVYNTPADLNFAARLEKVPTRIHLSPYDDETAEHCHWHIGESHFLEAWSDGRAYDGTLTFQQPLIDPLYATKSTLELVAFMAGERRSAYEILRGFYKEQWKTANFERAWKRAVHDGLLVDSGRSGVSVKGRPLGPERYPDVQGLTLELRADPYVLDGRFANNGWLQELPRPMTKITWDNPVLISPILARELNLESGDEVDMIVDDKRAARAPVWVMPGQADRVIVATLGFGRTRGGSIAVGPGFNAYALRHSDSPWMRSGVVLQKTGRHVKLASTQTQHSMVGRNLVRTANLEEYKANPSFAKNENPHESLYPPQPKWDGPAWAMVIDLNSCVGCNACMIACQAENNIPVVGKTEVMRGRSMHWIRVDRYFEGTPEKPDIHFEPVTCMHCENAPCEPVCPAAATTHSKEGLNEMVYNRCVGTRYCLNNCPYKVRRFNFLQYSDLKTESLKPMRNPNVTVRERGVMEKCSYCVQRINGARIEAKKENREIRDGEVTTACQGACPAQAITFGNMADPESRVARLRELPLHYGLLVELNTRPRTTYLAKVTNPNPRVEKKV